MRGKILEIQHRITELEAEIENFDEDIQLALMNLWFEAIEEFKEKNKNNNEPFRFEPTGTICSTFSFFRLKLQDLELSLIEKSLEDEEDDCIED